MKLVATLIVLEEEVHHHQEEEIVQDLVTEDVDHHQHLETIDIMTIGDHAIIKMKLKVLSFYQEKVFQTSKLYWWIHDAILRSLFSRTRVRNESKKTIWAPSPERPTRSVSPEDKRKSKKKHSKKYDSESDEDSSEEERRRRHKRKHHKSKSYKSSRHSKKSRTKYSSDDASDSDDYRKQKALVEVDPSQLDAVKDLWIEKKGN